MSIVRTPSVSFTRLSLCGARTTTFCTRTVYFVSIGIFIYSSTCLWYDWV